MDWKLRYKEETIVLGVEPAGDNGFVATFGDREAHVVFERLSEHRLRLIVDGRQTAAFVVETAEGKAVMVEGRTFFLADDRAPQMRSRSGAKAGPRTVTPPMPAVVTQILVAAGQTVEQGQALVVVSAMKMDTTLTAPYAGVVTRINVTEGEKVAPKQVLVDIEPAAPDASEDGADGQAS
jgi:3-methylcrotonyl-CoA carboxylase alpha subunit